MLYNFVFILYNLLIQCFFPPVVSARPRQVLGVAAVYGVMVQDADFWFGSAKALQTSDGSGCISVPDHRRRALRLVWAQQAAVGLEIKRDTLYLWAEQEGPVLL